MFFKTMFWREVLCSIHNFYTIECCSGPTLYGPPSRTSTGTTIKEIFQYSKTMVIQVHSFNIALGYNWFQNTSASAVQKTSPTILSLLSALQMGSHRNNGYCVDLCITSKSGCSTEKNDAVLSFFFLAIMFQMCDPFLGLLVRHNTLSVSTQKI